LVIVRYLDADDPEFDNLNIVVQAVTAIDVRDFLIFSGGDYLRLLVAARAL
jgi:hypothetical protein